VIKRLHMCFKYSNDRANCSLLWGLVY